MKTLKIEIPEGFEIDSFNKETGKIMFKPVPKLITDRIKDFFDVLDYHKLCLSDFEARMHGLSTDEIAYRKLKLIAEALNEGWKPDWTNYDQYKYYPWFDLSAGSACAFSNSAPSVTFAHIGSPLCFKTRERAIHAGTHFKEIYTDFLL